MDDVNDIVEGLNNLNVTKWLQGALYPYTEQDALHFINKSLDNNLYNFAFVLKSENKVIGETKLTNIDLHMELLTMKFGLVKSIGVKDMVQKLLCLE